MGARIVTHSNAPTFSSRRRVLSEPPGHLVHTSALMGGPYGSPHASPHYTGLLRASEQCNLYISISQLQNGNNGSNDLIGVVRGLNEIMLLKGLTQA